MSETKPTNLEARKALTEALNTLINALDDGRFITSKTEDARVALKQFGSQEIKK